MSTSREKMERAQRAIREQRWDDARQLLRGVNHPMALDWLDKIDEKDPPNNKRKNMGGVLMLAIALLVLIGAVAFMAQQYSNNQSAGDLLGTTSAQISIKVTPTVSPLPLSTFTPEPNYTKTSTSVPTQNETQTKEAQLTSISAAGIVLTAGAKSNPLSLTLTAIAIEPTATRIPTKISTHNKTLGSIRNNNELVARWLSCNLPESNRDIDLILHKVAEDVYRNNWSSAGTTMVIYSSNCSVADAFDIVWYSIFVSLDGDSLLPYTVDWDLALSEFKSGWYR